MARYSSEKGSTYVTRPIPSYRMKSDFAPTAAEKANAARGADDRESPYVSSAAPAKTQRTSRAKPEGRELRFYQVVLVTAAITATSLLTYIEYRYSFIQARYFSAVAAGLQYQVEPGPSNSIRFPQTGPYDHRLGYAELPNYLEKLDAQGYKVRAQARLSRELSRLIAAGYSPPYPENAQ